MQKESGNTIKEEAVQPKSPAAAGKPKSGARRWLGRIGTFLMMGGWILVAIVVIGIFILVSVLSK